MKNERDECIHGSLRRSCEICERDAEIDRLREALDRIESMATIENTEIQKIAREALS